jgi:hypothetical protein
MAEARRCILGLKNKLINLDSVINVNKVRLEFTRHTCGARFEDPFLQRPRLR